MLTITIILAQTQTVLFDTDTELMLMPLVCPSVRAEGAEEGGLRGRVSGRPGGGV